MPIQSINPATELLIGEYEAHSDSELEKILGMALKEFNQKQRNPGAALLDSLQRAAELLESGAGDFGRLITQEMGKPITQSMAEIQKCADLCRYYAENAGEFLEPSVVVTESQRSYVRNDPLGPLLVIMPWNFPFWQVFRAAVPALCAGNPVLLKHASNVTGCALAVEQILRRSGITEPWFQVILLAGEKMPALIARPEIRAVTLTGSETAGRAVAAAAGENLKKCVLELGGSDPFIVLGDADIRRAARTAAQARCINSGQSCIAAKRFIVEKSIAPDFIAAFRDALSGLKPGDPMQKDTDVGPLARADLRDELHEQLQRSILEGAMLHLGGEMPDTPGFYYPVTCIESNSIYNVAFQDETFGPLAALIVARDENEAILMANNSRYGLGGSLWTADLEKAATLCERIETGSITVNDLLRSDVRMPFGGIKDSGFGREMGRDGILEFVNRKSIRINPA
jgi:acyl-CoA reductase-like NAD-dependent aldehyde dehydrogenase